MAPFSLSWKIFSPPPRNETLTLSEMSIPAGPALPLESLTGPGDCVLIASEVSGARDGMLCDNREAPHISHERSEGWLEKVHRGH